MAAVVAVEGGSILSTIFGAVFSVSGFMIGGAIISSGVQSAKNMDDVNKAVDAANTQYDDLEKRWKAVFATEAKIDNDIKNSITTTFTNINDSITKANASHDLIKGQCKQIQYLGIMMILFVFILLLMKHYDLFNLK